MDIYGCSSNHSQRNNIGPSSDGKEFLDQNQPKQDPKEFVNIFNNFRNANQQDFLVGLDENQNIFESSLYARTMPTHAMQSINMDQIRLKSKINNISYAHGGVFVTAPFMLANPHW